MPVPCVVARRHEADRPLLLVIRLLESILARTRTRTYDDTVASENFFVSVYCWKLVTFP